MSTASKARIPRPPEYLMRYMLFNRGMGYIPISIGGSLIAGFAYAYFYVLPSANQVREFEKNYDGYEAMRRICSYPKKYMISCPDVLYEKLKEKGLTVGEDPFAPRKEKPASAPVDKEAQNENSVESFNT